MAAESRVILPPSAKTADYDFIAFSYNGIFSTNEDFTIYRVSDGSRYNIDVNPTLQDKTAEIPGGDGMYYFGNNLRQKNFNISFAFDRLTEKGLKKLKQWLNSRDIADLWFAEEPYKVYSAKPSGQISLKTVPFEENGERIYKGEGTVQFVAYWPYAHTPDYVGSGTNDGKKISSYSGFRNIEEWRGASGLTNDAVCQGENYGELPTYFVMTAPNTISKEDESELTFKIGELVIVVPAKSVEIIPEEKDGEGKVIKEEERKYTHHSAIQWDSKTGIVSAMFDNVRKPIMYTGESLGTIPVDGISKKDISINGATLKYHYWYY